MRTDEFVHALDALTPGEGLKVRVLGMDVRPRRVRLDRPGRLLAALGAAAAVCACAVVAVAVLGSGGAPGVGGAVTSAAGTHSGTPAKQGEAEATQSAATGYPKEIVNILILGTDTNVELEKDGMNVHTDCIIVAAVNTSTKAMSLISIPRNTYVMICDEKNDKVSNNKINAAYKMGGGLQKHGIAYAVNTVKQYLGGAFPIDHYVLFDMDFAKELIDAVGGVTVDVDISADVDGVHLTPGKKKLSGQEALVYARDRHNTKDGDIGRGDHQQQVIIALLRDLQNKGNMTSEIPELFDAFSAHISSSLQGDALSVFSLAFIAGELDPDTVKQYTLSGTYQTLDSKSVVISDQENMKAVIMEVYGVDCTVREDTTAH